MTDLPPPYGTPPPTTPLPPPLAPDFTAPITVPGPPAPPPAAHRRRGPGVLGTVLIAVVVAAVVGAFAGLAGYVVGRSIDASSETTVSAPVAADPGTVASVPLTEGSVADIAATTLPAVVSILAEGTTESGSGSGFVIRRNGYILTNNHVVDLVADGGTLTVVFSDGERSEGTVVGTNPSYDLAVVKVDRRGLPAIALGDSASVRVGDVAIAIGAPLGLDDTVTSGIVSAVDRPVTAGEESDVAYINAIQTDAAINPGNSGGPLVDAQGRVIGVNSAIASLGSEQGGQSGSIGLGFAIPVNQAKRVAEEIISTGRSTHPIMGVSVDLTYSGPGAQIKGVTSGGPAQDAGLDAGDVVVAIDGRSVSDSTELIVAIRTHAPGDTVTVEVKDGSGTRDVRVTLDADASTG